MLEVITDWKSVIEAVLATECDIGLYMALQNNDPNLGE